MAAISAEQVKHLKSDAWSDRRQNFVTFIIIITQTDVNREQG